MALIEHPVFSDQRRDVPDDVLADWVAAGWVRVNKDGSSPAESAPARKEAAEAVAANTPTNEPVILSEGPTAANIEQIVKEA